MIEVNISSSVNNLLTQLNSLDKDELARESASSLMPMIRKRVHVDGLDADGSQIGTYSDGYMKVRTGNYPETKVTKGQNAGQFRERKKKGQAGVFTKGKNKGQPRPTYNRQNDTKVVLSLTSQMEQDMQVIQTENGYGIGYSNELNFNKAIWNATRYKKNIWGLSVEESNTMESIGERYVKERLNND